MLNYNDFINENQIYNLLLESKVIYSSKFINILNKMKGNKISRHLLEIYSKDFDVTQNYIDITDEKDSASFTQDRRAKNLVKDELWKVVNSGRYLTHSDRNNNIFKKIGYDKTKQENWAPEVGTIGKILAETISPSSGNIYVLFQEEVNNGVDPRLSVINKEALVNAEESDNPKVWSLSRNKIKIGRLVRALLTSSNFKFTDKDIEDFVNQYKSTYDFINDALSRFDIVKGNYISYWYDIDNYENDNGTLGNSCMASVDSYFFRIYVENTNQVSLVILYDDNGGIIDDRYKSNKIKGRALLWDASIDGTKAKFMDRIYTNNDSDVELFKQFAEKNGFWYKVKQDSLSNCHITNGEENKKPLIIVNLDNGDFEEYPYLDTLCYLNSETGEVSNKAQEIDADRILNDTSGGFDNI